MTRGVVVLGSTGSVGTQALDVIARHADDYRVVALAAGRNRDLLAEQARTFGVPADLARSCVDAPEALAELAAHPDADVVLNAVVGFAGLPATIAALEAGTRLALANKESLIAAGPVVAKARAVRGELGERAGCVDARTGQVGRHAEGAGLLGQQVGVAPRGESNDPVVVRMTGDDVERLRTDGAGRAEDDDPTCHRTSLRSATWEPVVRRLGPRSVNLELQRRGVAALSRRSRRLAANPTMDIRALQTCA